MPSHGIGKAITIHRLEGLEVGQLLKFVLHAAGNEVRSRKSAAGFAYVHSPKAPRPIIYILKQMIVQFAILARIRRRHGALHNQLAMPDNREESFRSEEHTSELQSLMRISYAVFCLKKKNNKKL